ncbi:MAG: hypothetical protein AAF849_21040 [Bacteroidota bacterium]
MRLLLLISIFLFATTSGFGQTTADPNQYSIKDTQANLKKVLKKAQKKRGEKKYEDALGLYEAAIKIDSTDSDVLYETATIYDSLSAYVAANRLYHETAVHQGEKVYSLLTFQHAKVLKTLGDYEAAVDSFQSFKRFIGTSPQASVTDFYLREADQYIEFCQQAIQIKNENPSEYTGIANVGDPVNDTSRVTSEFAPYEENGTLYFSRFKYAEAEAEQGKYELDIFKHLPTAIGINRVLDTKDVKEYRAYVSMSADGNYLYEVGCKELTTDSENESCKIYRRERAGTGNWSKRVLLPNSINLDKYSNSQPAIGTEGGKEYLYFSSNRPGGAGGRDIWRAEILSHKSLSYGEPVNLQRINTDADEISPYFHDRCGILYFSSDRKPSLGGFDIYQSEANGGAYIWEAPQTLGYPINSSFDDVDFFRSPTGEKAYFASKRVPEYEREGDRVVKGCCLDIYEANLDMIVEQNIQVRCGTDLVQDAIYTYSGMTPKGTAYTPKDSSFLLVNPIQLRVNEQYQFTVTKEGYTTSIFNRSTTGNEVCDLTSYFDTVYIRPNNNLIIELSKLVEEGTAPINAEDSVSVRLEMSEGALIDSRAMVGSRLEFPVEPNGQYRLLIESPRFKSEDLNINLPSIEDACFVERKVTLAPDIFKNQKPVSIYFHNAIPRRIVFSGDQQGRSDDSYQDNYNAYIAMQDDYKEGLSNYYRQRNFTATVVDTFFSKVDSRINSFFKNDVTRGYDKLNIYKASLVKHFRTNPNDTVSINIRGSASPRSSVTFNQYLSQRRINSVKNYLMEPDDLDPSEVLLKAFNSNRLLIKEQPLGQLNELSNNPDKNAFAQARMDITDDFGVYDPIAARTRKVTIEAFVSAKESRKEEQRMETDR